MVEDNKIITFSTTHKKNQSKDKKVISYNPNHKNRNKAQFYLKYELSVYLFKKNKQYIAEFSASDRISDYKIYTILKAIFSKIENRLPSKMSKRKEYSKITFSLLYFENEKDANDFRYICTAPNVTTEQLAEYLLFAITMYELKNPIS